LLTACGEFGGMRGEIEWALAGKLGDVDSVCKKQLIEPNAGLELG
jgi:hypothetical protein